MKKIFIVFFMLTLVVLPAVAMFTPAPALAQGAGIDNKMDEIKEYTQLGDADPRIMAARAINVILGFLGIIAVIIILFGGFKWMTAGGNEDKVNEAKKTIGAGVIGLFIILAAFGLAKFVIDAMYLATGAAAV